MTVLSVSIPNNLYAYCEGEGRISTILKRSAFIALETGEHSTPPVTNPSDPTVKVNLNSRDEKKIKDAMRHSGIKQPNEFLAGLAWRHFLKLHSNEDGKSEAGARSQSASKYIKEPRREQLSLLREMYSSSERQQVLLLEASTGTGKGRAGLAHVCHQVDSGQVERVVVAAPTLQVMAQLMLELDKLVFPTKSKVIAGGVVGAKEYVSEVLLSELLDTEEDLPDRDLARTWLDKHANEPSGVLQHTWMATDLAHYAPNFPVHEVVLRHHLLDSLENSKDAGALMYRASFSELTDINVIFCTHAMLAMDIVTRRGSLKDLRLEWSDYEEIRRKELAAGITSPSKYEVLDNEKRLQEKDVGIFPHYDSILIDEGHMLERTFSASLAGEISFLTLGQLIKEAGLDSHYKEFNRIFKKIVLCGENHDEVVISGSEDTRELQQLIKHLSKIVKKACKTAAKQKTNKSLELKHVVDQLNNLQAKSSFTNYVGTITFSPIRKYPRLQVARKSVSAELDFLWRRLHSAVVMSATLYMPKYDGIDATYSRFELAIPTERLATMIPITPKWITDKVHLYLPDEFREAKDKRSYLQPPKNSENKRQTNQYYKEISDTVYDILSSKRPSGGTLILLTSYEAQREINKHLSETSLARRVMCADKDKRFELVKEEYLEKVKANKKPVWLAVGKAWTGLDLTLPGKAANDNAIEIEIIPRLPFLSNRSNTHINRLQQSNANFQYEIFNTVRTLLQGMGRLVRRRGVPDKHLYILDARLGKESERAYIRPLKAAFMRYSNRRTLKR